MEYMIDGLTAWWEWRLQHGIKNFPVLILLVVVFIVYVQLLGRKK